MIVLCGGVGGSKLVLGLYRTVPAADLTVVVNTADDTDFCGLRVSPDLDTVVYTLAGMAGPKGWGVADDTFHALSTLDRLGAPGWFRVGDRDLGTSVFRTWQLRDGKSLTEVTGDIARSLGVAGTILPMTDGRVATRLRAGSSWLDFQDYFVRLGHRVPISAIEYVGMEDARPSAQVLTALEEADAVIFSNSNPVLSILPILSLPGMTARLRALPVPRIAVSPLVGRDAVSGPAGDLMRLLGKPPTSVGVAEAYRGLIDALVIDTEDSACAPEIEALGMRVLVTDTIMRTDADKERLARQVVDLARSLA